MGTVGLMKFGLFIPQGWRQDLTGIEPAQHWQVMNGLAQHADAGTAFDSVWVYDHMHTAPEPTAQATHEAWTLMAAFAASTSRVKLGQMCTCIGYRNPAHLAKVAATVDVISAGRAQMGIGAGWYEHEWRAYGYGFPAAGERLAMLEEGVQIMQQMWTTGSATLDGKHYQVDGALCYPQPLQDGGLPLWIAGGGERKTLRIAAQYATHTNYDGGAENFAHKSQVLAQHCKDVGRDFGEITRSGNYNVVIGETEKDVADRLAWHADHITKTAPDTAQVEINSLRGGPLVGTPEQLSETLVGLHGLGMTYAINYFPESAYDRSGLELFERSVVPQVQAAVS